METDVVVLISLVRESLVLGYIAPIGLLEPVIPFDVVARIFPGDILVLPQPCLNGMRTCLVVPWPDCDRFVFRHRLDGSFLADGKLIACHELCGIGFEGHSSKCGRAWHEFEA